jgi:hypothetical protein
MDVPYMAKDAMVQRLVLGRRQQCFHLSDLMDIQSVLKRRKAHSFPVPENTLSGNRQEWCDNTGKPRNNSRSRKNGLSYFAPARTARFFSAKLRAGRTASGKVLRQLA